VRALLARKAGRGTLPLDALLCIVRADSKELLAFASVARRDPQELAEQQPIVGLALAGQSDLQAMLKLASAGRHGLQDVLVVQVMEVGVLPGLAKGAQACG